MSDHNKIYTLKDIEPLKSSRKISAQSISRIESYQHQHKDVW